MIRLFLTWLLDVNKKSMTKCSSAKKLMKLGFWLRKQTSNFVDLEIEKLMKKKEQDGQFLSNIFLRPKKDGSFRMILNLKKLNVELPYHHFKMDSMQTCIQLMSQGGVTWLP